MRGVPGDPCNVAAATIPDAVMRDHHSFFHMKAAPMVERTEPETTYTLRARER